METGVPSFLVRTILIVIIRHQLAQRVHMDFFTSIKMSMYVLMKPVISKLIFEWSVVQVTYCVERVGVVHLWDVVLIHDVTIPNQLSDS